VYCMMCTKFKTSVCFKKNKVTKRMTHACSKFVFNTHKVPAKVLKAGIEFSSMPKTHTIALMALLDANLRLRTQNMTLGMSVPYTVTDPSTMKEKTFRVHLISSPKKDEYAYGVAFSDEPIKNTVTSVTLEKQRFTVARDKKLKGLWTKIEERLMILTNPKQKKLILLRAIKRLGKEYTLKMLRMNGINISDKGKSLSKLTDELLSTYL
jgi:hypothetical protein